MNVHRLVSGWSRTTTTEAANTWGQALGSGWFRRVLELCAFLLIVSAQLGAQVTSTIQGYISDPNGASVPKAKIMVTNEATGVSRSATSADDGYYRIPDLLGGTYRITVEHAGFKTVVRSGIAVTARTVVGENVTLELGAVTESVTVTGEGPQVETQAARINDVVNATDLQSLPMLGRTPVSLILSSPGITGKFESLGSAYCCDALSVLQSPTVSSSGNEFKSNYTVDGMSMRYGDGTVWGLSFMPNADALEEVNVAVSSYTAETGSLSGPQIQLITKGGTNVLHGSAHYLWRNSDLNAVPFRSTRKDVPDSYYRLFGGTLGGPIIKNRMFGFFAYEGRRVKTATSYVTLAETEAFKDWVVNTRPQSVAAQLLKDFPPLRYPTQGLVDLNGDGIPDLGEVVVNTPSKLGGRQLNGRIDYHFPGGKDRIYGSYWYTRPSADTGGALRPDFVVNFFGVVHYGNLAHSHAFSPNVLNEARFGTSASSMDNRHPSGAYKGAYHVPGIATDDGISMGNFAWSLDVWQTKVTEFGDTLSINRGRHGIKLGGGYVDRHLAYQSLIGYDTPEYDFASIFDFADDKPYAEYRTLDVASGKANKTDDQQGHRELYIFMQNTWQVRPNLTLNYGLRWEDFFSPWLKLKGKETWQPVLKSGQLTPSMIANVINRRIDNYTQNMWTNFGPRLSVAWDPTRSGKLSVRANFGILYDGVDAQHMYYVSANPPGTADVAAGPEYGVPIVYGLAPVGTRDFPPNPYLAVPKLTPQGGFEGTRAGLGGYANDLKAPRVYDTFVGVQYQLLPELMIFGDYRYRRSTNDLYAENLNRFDGDLLLNNGTLTRLNPYFDTINMVTNWGKRSYHGLVFGGSKRFSRGWSLDAHYTYNNARNNFGRVDSDQIATGTTAFRPDVDWARDDIPHVFTFRNVWELPVFRTRHDLVGRILGGWSLNSMWNLQAGGLFTPISTSRYGRGGDFNADGQARDRPDRPTANVPHSFSTQQWLQGTLKASVFPLPDPSEPRAGTLPRDYFLGPGYARIDLSAGKAFRIKERTQAQFRAEAFNAFNRINVSSVENRINRSNFGLATRAYNMRLIQFSLKLTF